MTIEVTNRTYAWSRMDTIMMIGGGGGGDFHDWYVAAIGTDTGILHHGGVCVAVGGRSFSGRWAVGCDKSNARAIQYR